jgi:hypothetical protein
MQLAGEISCQQLSLFCKNKCGEMSPWGTPESKWEHKSGKVHLEPDCKRPLTSAKAFEFDLGNDKDFRNGIFWFVFPEDCHHLGYFCCCCFQILNTCYVPGTTLGPANLRINQKDAARLSWNL